MPPLHRAAKRRTAASEAINVFVAATLSSGPAAMGSTTSDADAKALSGSLTMATVSAPEARAAPVISMRSSLDPDCEMVRSS